MSNDSLQTEVKNIFFCNQKVLMLAQGNDLFKEDQLTLSYNYNVFRFIKNGGYSAAYVYKKINDSTTLSFLGEIPRTVVDSVKSTPFEGITRTLSDISKHSNKKRDSSTITIVLHDNLKYNHVLKLLTRIKSTGYNKIRVASLLNYTEKMQPWRHLVDISYSDYNKYRPTRKEIYEKKNADFRKKHPKLRDCFSQRDVKYRSSTRGILSILKKRDVNAPITFFPVTEPVIKKRAIVKINTCTILEKSMRSESEIKEVISKRLGAIRFKYKALLRRKKDCRGFVTIQIGIGEDGSVEKTKITTSSIEDKKFLKDIQKMLSSMKFIPSGSKREKIEVRFEFYSEEGK